MGGGLLQLQAYGSQLMYLSGNPSMTYFKAVYKKYTNFASESLRVDFEGQTELSIDVDVQLRCNIPRSGDLINKMFFCINLPDIYSGYHRDYEDTNNKTFTELDYKFWWVQAIGTSMIKKVTLTIGGSKISEFYGEWIEIWHELIGDLAAKSHFDHLIGNVPEIFMPQYDGVRGGVYPTSTLNPELNLNPQDATKTTEFGSNPYLQKPSIKGRKLYVPLPFWFTTNPGLALPLLALQYHEVYVELELRKITELYTIIETKNIDGSVKKGQRRKPLFSQEHHHIGNFITGKNNEIFEFNTDLGDGNTNIQGWNMDAHMLVNYVFLDKDERASFAANSHEYLIEQVSRKQFLGIVGTQTLDLELEHPVKYLVWCGQRDDVVSDINAHNNFTNWKHEFIPPGTDSYMELVSASNQDELYYQTDDTGALQYTLPSTDTSGNTTTRPLTLDEDVSGSRAMLPTKFNFRYWNENIIQQTRLLFNGIERFSTKDSMYFEHLQPYQSGLKIDKKGILMYSFSLDPGKYQPSGACNMSRIKSKQLEIQTVPVYLNKNKNPTLQTEYKFNIYVYSVNYNILRVLSGMGSVAFSN
jgi:hypothetical protein